MNSSSSKQIDKWVTFIYNPSCGGESDTWSRKWIIFNLASSGVRCGITFGWIIITICFAAFLHLFHVACRQLNFVLCHILTCHFSPVI